MRIINPFRIGVDGDAATCRKKFERLKWYVRLHPEVARAAGLVVDRSPRQGSPRKQAKPGVRHGARQEGRVEHRAGNP